MFTDEQQFTCSLSNAFRSATMDLTYDRALPTPPRVSLATAPLLIATAACVGAVAVAATAGPAHIATQGHRTGPTATAVPAVISPKTGKVVTLKFTLAGYTMTYRQAADAQELYGQFVSEVPANAQPVDGPGAVHDGVPVTYYVGVDLTTGYNAAYVAPVSDRILEITSSDATRDELVALLMSANPTPIPVAGESGNQTVRHKPA
jgi:hypothetical protein